jgi:hypothetical protein
MINYNDGKWHGWNGGECPVHPESVVEVCSAVETVRKTEATPENVYWPNVIAFRVVEPYHEPREWWATGNHLHDTKEEADNFLASLRAANPGLNFDTHEPVLVREVLE